jgi:formylglycine-generating enzyme required for sulfatase activity
MIGNVYEWTSSEATYYVGNKYSVPDKERGWIVIRGGSYQSLLREAVDKRNGREFPATWRGWVERSRTDATLGFRLVRDGPR